jgi:Flp pilus assembly protein TadB
MILGIRIYRDEEGRSIKLPAFPLIAGAGTMTTFTLKSQFDTINIIIAIILNNIVYIVLKSRQNRNARRKRIRSHQEDVWRGAFGYCC